jgi:mannitol/fructose-specific phosphotransferase system IIA component (Ntr-type)
MTLAQFTEPKLLVPRLVSDHREAAIIELSSRLEIAGRIENANSFGEAALAHELVASAVFDDVAFPLARGQAVRELSFALGLSPRGIRWRTERDPVIYVVVLFAVPLSGGQPYLSLVVTFSKFLRDDAGFATLRQCARSEEMFAALQQVRVRSTGPQLTADEP